MPTPVKRLAVDLSRYPDLVVVYLGMRVNRITGLKTLFGFGPRITKSVKGRPTAYLAMETSFSRFFPWTRGCASTGATWIRCCDGRALIRTASGGRTSCAARAAPGSGTRRTRSWRHGSHLRRRRAEDRIHGLCTCRSRPGIDVHCHPPLEPRRESWGSGVGRGTVREVATRRRSRVARPYPPK